MDEYWTAMDALGYGIGGVVIALRLEDAAQIFVETRRAPWA